MALPQWDSQQQHSPSWLRSSVTAHTFHCGCTQQLSSGQCIPSVEVSGVRACVRARACVCVCKQQGLALTLYIRSWIPKAIDTCTLLSGTPPFVHTNLRWCIYTQPCQVSFLQQPLYNDALVGSHCMVKGSPAFLQIEITRGCIQQGMFLFP